MSLVRYIEIACEAGHYAAHNSAFGFGRIHELEVLEGRLGNDRRRKGRPSDPQSSADLVKVVRLRR